MTSSTDKGVVKMGKKDAEAEDLAIQDTLTMSVQERLKLIASLIVDKIDEDLRNGQALLGKLEMERTE